MNEVDSFGDPMHSVEKRSKPFQFSNKKIVAKIDEKLIKATKQNLFSALLWESNAL